MKLDLICARDKYRPAFGYVEIKRDFMVATDATILGVIPTNELFSEEFINLMPDNGFYIEKNEFARLRRFYLFTLENDIIRCISLKGKGSETVVKITFPKDDFKFPNWKNILNFEFNSVEKIGINAKRLLRLQNALGLDQCVLTFQSESKFVKVSGFNTESKAYGIIMPFVTSF
jgi:uncharacterized Fe-S cluster-containing radical SAM superfamily protein